MMDDAPCISLIALALLAAPLSGCVGTDDDSSTQVATAGENRETEEDPAPAGALSFANRPVSATVWENGTFTTADAAQGATTTVVDVTDQLPDVGPVEIEAVLTYDAGPVPSNPSGNGPASMDVTIDTGEAPVYTQNEAEEAGREVSNVTFGRTSDEPVEITVRYNTDDGTGGTEASYSLEVWIEAIPHAIPIDAPAGVDVPEEAAQIKVLPAVEGRPLSAHAWSPSDAHLGYEQASGNGSLAFPVEEAGEHVLMPNGSAVVLLSNEEGRTLEAESPLRLLDYEFQWGERHSLPPDGPETWSFDVDHVPLTVAIRMNAQQGDSTIIDRISFLVESENGTVWDLDIACTPNPENPLPGAFCFAVGATTGFDGVEALAPFGDEDLGSGTHDFTVRYNASGNIDITPGWVHYAR